jgi:hypothetical protein
LLLSQEPHAFSAGVALQLERSVEGSPRALGAGWLCTIRSIILRLHRLKPAA